MSKLPQELKKKLIRTGFLSFVLLAAAIVLENLPKAPDYRIKRPAVGEGPRTETLLVGDGEIKLEIGAVEYEENEIELLHAENTEWLRSVIFGENDSPEKIRSMLFLPGKTEKRGEAIYWVSDTPWLVNSSGEVRNEELEYPVQVKLTAEISYGSETRKADFLVTVLEKEYSEEEKALRTAEKELSGMEQATRTSSMFELPREVLGKTVSRKEEEDLGVAGFLLLTAMLLPAVVYYHYTGEQEEERKKRQETAESSYVEFVTKLALLLAAGITVRQAMLRMVEEYEKNYGPAYLITSELKVIKQELETGYSEGAVFESFGRRMGTLQYQRLASLLSQNSAKGVQGIRTLLLQEAAEVMARERAVIKVKGEQAGTKLLLPMMVLLGLVFAILLVPAFQTM